MLKKYPTLRFILHRIAWYFLTFLVAITINFFLPRLGDANPITIIMSKQHAEGEAAKEKETAYLKEFGLVETLDLVKTNNDKLLMDSKGNPITFKELKEKGLLKLDEKKTLWNAEAIVKEKQKKKLRKSVAKLLASKKGELKGLNAEKLLDAEKLENQENFLASVKDVFTVDEIKSLKGLKIKVKTEIYTVDVAKLKAAYSDGITEVDSPQLVAKGKGKKSGFAFYQRNGKDKEPTQITFKSDEGLPAELEIIKSEEVINKLITEKVEETDADGKVLSSVEKVKIEPIETPMIKQYFRYLGMVLTGDLGTSFMSYPKKVNTIIAEAVPWTLALQFPTIVLGWLAGNLLGALAAYKRGIFDKIFFPLAMLSNSIPFFAFGMILLYFFGEIFGWFPTSGGYAPNLMPGFTGAFIVSAAWHYVLPFLSVFPIFASGQATGMRSMGIYELGTGYVKYAKVLGIKEGKILMYIFRNAMLPQLTGLAIMLGVMIGGALITEMIFSYPGLGMALLDATTKNDYPLIQGAALIVTITVLIANFTVDILIGFFDPRVKAGRTGA